MTKASDLSGGQKRKLCLSIAFMGSPEFVVLDEPTAGIDVNSRQVIWKAISLFKNTTSLITSHSLEEAELVSSRLFVMKSGKIVFMGTSTELRKEYKCGYRITAIGKNINFEKFHEIVSSFIPDATKNSDRPDSILIPISDQIADFVEQINIKIKEFNADEINITVEGLEHVILRLISDEENHK